MYILSTELKFGQPDESKVSTSDVNDEAQVVNMTPNPAYGVAEVVKVTANPAYGISSTAKSDEDPSYLLLHE